MQTKEDVLKELYGSKKSLEHNGKTVLNPQKHIIELVFGIIFLLIGVLFFVSFPLDGAPPVAMIGLLVVAIAGGVLVYDYYRKVVRWKEAVAWNVTQNRDYHKQNVEELSMQNDERKKDTFYMRCVVAGMIFAAVLYFMTDQVILSMFTAGVFVGAGVLILSGIKKIVNSDSKAGGIKMIAIGFIVAICAFGMFQACSGGNISDPTKCTICGKPATHQFQGSGYCDKHYDDAVDWAIDNVADDD